MSDDCNKKTTGPPPKTVKLNEPWEEAISKALRKKRPESGWPDAKAVKPTKKKPA